MNEYVIFLPVDKEYLKVDGVFYFDYEQAVEHLDLYKKRMLAMYKTARDDKDYQKVLITKIRSAVIQQKVTH